MWSVYHDPGTMFDSEGTMSGNLYKVPALRKFIFKSLGLDLPSTIP